MLRSAKEVNPPGQTGQMSKILQKKNKSFHPKSLKTKLCEKKVSNFFPQQSVFFSARRKRVHTLWQMKARIRISGLFPIAPVRRW